jgi:hypothetical protein
MYVIGALVQSALQEIHSAPACRGCRPRSTWAGLTPALSALGLSTFVPHLRRDWVHPCHICAGTGCTPATSAPGLQMTLRSKHLAALDSTVAGDSDVKLIFGDSTMQASLLGMARSIWPFFPAPSQLVRSVLIVPRNMVQDLRGFRLCVGLAECRARRAQNLLPSRRLATRARVSRRNKQKTHPHRFDTRGAAPRLPACWGYQVLAHFPRCLRTSARAVHA